MRPRLTTLRSSALLVALSLSGLASCSTSGSSTSAKTTRALLDAVPYGVGFYLATATINAFPESRGIMVASQPVGARVLVDGRDSGFATPCCLAIDRKKQRIDLVLDGYQPASRVVTDDDRTYLIYWDEAYLGPNTYRFPTFLNFYDGWVPVRFEQTYSPERLFVRLRPAGTP
ncbi:MAG TPA: PEGA domain-containing protein [Planctomycetota bacterium]|nr:PEGA domain-containing protein [Planctomycetota bacterium]